MGGRFLGVNSQLLSTAEPGGYCDSHVMMNWLRPREVKSLAGKFLNLASGYLVTYGAIPGQVPKKLKVQVNIGSFLWGRKKKRKGLLR